MKHLTWSFSCAKHGTLPHLMLLKAGIHYTAFVQVFFGLTFSLDESALVAECQSQSAVCGQSELTDFRENHVVFEGHRLYFFNIMIPFSQRISNIFDI